MKNKIKKVLIVAGILIIYIVASFFMIREYNWNRQNITGPETPIEIAREFMQKRYNYHWGILMGMNYAGRDTGHDVAYVYEIGKRHKDYTWYYDMILDGAILGEAGQAVGCEREIRDKKTKISTTYSYPTDYISMILGDVAIYNVKGGYWETGYFGLEYIDGEYIVADWFDEGFTTEEEIEKYTQMTIDEIVAIAYEDQENLEKILYKMQKRTLYAETIRLIVEILLLTLGSEWLIRRKVRKGKTAYDIAIELESDENLEEILNVKEK
ncbi:MAG: hypothetical protein J6K37_04630 [Lachnospiraceae bacterium]|nr:hypothetical protein [Lachnospiraceae bacterium]